MPLNGSKLLAADIGATNIRVAIGETSGRILAKKVERTRVLGRRTTIPEQLTKMSLDLMKKHGIEKNELVAVGIGSIGPLDVSRGIITQTANLPYRGVPLRKPIEEQFGVPVAIAGDCVAAVFGERNFGRAKAARNVVYVTFSTGIGVGAIVDGHLLMGNKGNAALLGHMTLDMEDRMLCGCGKFGHWEAYCSARNIPNYARLLMGSANSAKKSLLLKFCDGNLSRLTAEMLFRAARASDKVAREIVMKIGRINALAVANVTTAFDPELIILGGALSLSNRELLLVPIKKWIGKYLILRPTPKIVITALGDDVVLYGALALARELQEQTGSSA